MLQGKAEASKKEQKHQKHNKPGDKKEPKKPKYYLGSSIAGERKFNAL
jgi:hypothetical protein